MRIRQLYSAFGSHFKIPFLKKYGMKPYTNVNEPVFFFGCYGNQIEKAFQNKSKVKIAFAGTDAWNFIHNKDYVSRVKARPDIEFIAISTFIKDDLDSVGIPSKLIPIVPMNNSDIKPCPLGEKIYAYRSAYNPKIFRLLQKELPQFEFIDARLHTFGREELLEKYKESFIGIRLTNHDGCANTAIELGLMGRKIIWNGGSPSSIPFDLKNTDKIIEDIIYEYNNRKTANYTQVAKKVNDYLDVGEDFLEY